MKRRCCLSIVLVLFALGADVTVGVLIQSTAGHGWNGKVQLSSEPWQHAVYADGKENPRWCQLDPGFRAYVLDAFRSICRENPAFLLVDDDFGPRQGEGFCPLHVARYYSARLIFDVLYGLDGAKLWMGEVRCLVPQILKLEC